MEHMWYAKGISWIDDCRIPFIGEKDPSKERYKSYRNVDALYGGYGDTHYEYKEQTGRFPANILVCDDMLNDGTISKNGDIKPHIQKRKTNVFNSNQVISSFKSDKGSNSRYYDIDKWFENLLESCE